jgi:hypothetical protein
MQARRSVLAALLLAPAAAAQFDVAVLGVTPGDACYIPDVAAKLQASGSFASVDVYDAGTSTPDLPTLLAYPALLVYSDFPGFQDPALLGDTLADYVDAGGGVVTAMFVANPNLSLGGRWMTGYEALLATGQQQSSQQFLGTVHLPAHPVMNGVATFDGGWSGGMGSFRPSGAQLAAGATSIAEWSDGTPLVVEGSHPKRIDLGFYPVSGSCDPRFWNPTTDGAAMMVNALLHVGAGAPPTAYCTAGTTSHGCVPSIGATGAPSATAANGFTITVSAVEGQRSGLVFYGIDNGGFTPLPWSSASTSFLCVKPPVQRTPALNSGGTPALCDGVLSVDWNAFVFGTPGALGAPFAGGEHVHAQGWFRDPPAPKTTNLSDGLSFFVGP